MKLGHLLEKHEKSVVQKWCDVVIDTYPPDTARFLKSQADPFANPVGSTTLKNLQSLLEGIQRGLDRETAVSLLDPIIRIRAVQKFTPSQAIGFILSLKTIIRTECSGAMDSPEILKEMAVLDSQIDDLCLVGFDVYMTCKETIYKIKANEQRNRVFSAFERAGLVTDDPGSDPNSGSSNLNS
ncbi:Uncharacterized protein DVU1291 [Olavius algarvensis associated proteobacterium Delta 3]|nr:Uncharacterized protein DVU1291 [Olavius algarvensis associated proteobacterium Delta 3]